MWLNVSAVDSRSPSWQYAIMIKTQVQIPDDLYRDAKRVAAEYEMSFAEVVRRSLERTLPAYPPKSGRWQPPEPLRLGMRGQVEDDEWRLLANEPDYVPKRLRKARR
jgi:hypothetical protein